MDADVVVLGAGAAGLAAARSVARRSLQTLVVEARDRVGGRAWSHPAGRAVTPAELGAEFIHGPAEETLALLRDAGAAAVDNVGEAWLLFDDGKLRREERDFAAAAGIFEQARALAHDESVDVFLRRFDGDPSMQRTIATARAFAEGFDAVDSAIASAQAIGDEIRSGVDSRSARPLGGYRRLFEHLQQTCADAGVTTCLSSAVRRISWRRGAVDVDVRSRSGESRTIRARAAIVTLPIGVLRHRGDESDVAFDPSLPAAKREALAHIEMGRAARVTLRFRTAFWEQLDDGRYRDAAFFRCPELPFAVYWTQLPVRSELIVAWAGGPKAAALSGASPAERIERALDGLGTLLGEPARMRQEFEGGVTHDWDRDPFARGAYSYVIVGGAGARENLAAPVDDTLFFAGEATSNDGQGGTVNGALHTGERAAAQAAAALAAQARAIGG